MTRTRFGWCDRCTPDHPSRYHNLCHITFTSSVGVPHECDCPVGHEREEQ